MNVNAAVTSLLRKYAGKYLEGLDADKISVGLGTTVLKDLVLSMNDLCQIYMYPLLTTSIIVFVIHDVQQLKSTAFDDLGLPVQIRAGHVGTLRITLNWTSLAAQIELEDVYAVLNTKADVKFDQTRDEKSKLAAKESQLKALEDEDAKAAKENASAQKNQAPGYFARLMSKIIENLKVTIRRVHIRLDDTSSRSGMPFSVGIFLEELAVHATSDHSSTEIEKRTYPKRMVQVRKTLSITRFAIYIDVGRNGRMQKPLDGITSAKRIRNHLSQVFTSVANPPEAHDYLLRPLGLVLTFLQNSNPSKDVPQFEVQVQFKPLVISLTKQQYSCTMALVDTLSHYKVYARYRSLKGALGTQRPVDRRSRREWWRYAYRCVVSDIQERARRRSWTRVLRLIRWRKQYVRLYVKHLGGAKNTDQLQQLHKVIYVHVVGQDEK